MIPIADYHMHTPLCEHAVGTPSQYAETALTMGLEEIGFSDHMPFESFDEPGIRMRLGQLPEYHQMIENVREQYKDRLKIKVGIEADFILGCEEEIKKILSGYAYDYIIGSVHYIDSWGFDNPEQSEGWEKQDVNDVYRDYHKTLRQSAQTSMYDIIGHADLVKKFGHRATADLSDEIRETAEVFKKCGLAIEINTSGLRKPVGEIYPSLFDLKIYCEVGVPIVFGSDAHHYEEVAQDFDKALDLAKQAGYKEYVLFGQRKIVKKIEI